MPILAGCPTSLCGVLTFDTCLPSRKARKSTLVWGGGVLFLFDADPFDSTTRLSSQGLALFPNNYELGVTANQQVPERTQFRMPQGAPTVTSAPSAMSFRRETNNIRWHAHLKKSRGKGKAPWIVLPSPVKSRRDQTSGLRDLGDRNMRTARAGEPFSTATCPLPVARRRPWRISCQAGAISGPEQGLAT